MTTRIVAKAGPPLPHEPSHVVRPSGGGKPEVYVSAHQMQVVEDYYTTDDVVMACKEVLQWFLFREEVQIIFGALSKPFRSEYAVEFRTFFVDALDSFLKFGFVVWASVPGNCGQPVPRVLDTGSYTLMRTINRDLSVTYRAESMFYGNTEADGPRPFVSVEVVPGYAPTMFGNLNSKVSTLLWADENSRAMQLYARRAAAEASDPTVFTEMRDDKSGTAPATVALAYFNVDKSKKRKTYDLDDEQQRRLDRQLQRKRQRNMGIGARTWEQPQQQWRVDPETGRRESVDDAEMRTPSVPLPRGQTLGRQTMPVMPSNVLQWEEKREAKVCAVFGVPRSASALRATGSGGQQVATAVNSEMNMLHATIDKTKTVLTLIGESVLNKMLGPADREEIRDRLMDEKDPEEQARLERALQCERLYRVEFGLTSNLTTQDLKELHGSKVLKPEPAARLFASTYGIPEDYVDQKALKEWKDTGFGPQPGSALQSGAAGPSSNAPSGGNKAAAEKSSSSSSEKSKASADKAGAEKSKADAEKSKASADKAGVEKSSSSKTQASKNKKKKRKASEVARKQPARSAKRKSSGAASTVQARTPQESASS